MASNTDLARRWFTEVWCEPRRDDCIDELMHEKARVHDLGTPEPLGRDDFKAFRQRFLRMVPDVHVEVTQMIEQDDTVAIFAETTGTHADSGQPLRFSGGAMAVFENGRIVESRGAWDFLTMMVQAGVVAPEVVERQFAEV